MAINVRQKGAGGEREVADAMNFILYELCKELQFPEAVCLKAMQSVQRNQNQTAVGGSDLVNTFGLSVEVKRQETLNVEAWWLQCLRSAQRSNEVPVLVYRQNRKPWRVRTLCYCDFPDGKQMQVVGEISWNEFKAFWRGWARQKLVTGHEIRA